MASTLVRLFLVFLGLSHLLCLKAIPVTRTEGPTQIRKVHLVPENKQEFIKEKMQTKEESSVGERMDMELHDYSPYGANTRHTPRGT